MQTDLIPKNEKPLVIRSEPIELFLSDDGNSRLALVLPPFEDLSIINDLAGQHFSLKIHADNEWEPLKAAFALELEQLERKSIRFSDSKTFITHLANLAELAGKRDQEYQTLSKATSIAQDIFFQHRLGENLQARGKLVEAEKIFSTFDLNRDATANLRMAYFYAQKNDLDRAKQSIAKVIEIDPTNYGGRLFEGALRLTNGEYHGAIQSFRIAEEERPTSSVLLTNLSIAYLCIKKNDKAAAALRKAVALDPLNQNAVVLLADVAHSTGRDEDALPALRYFINFEQRIPAIWGRLARSLLRLGQASEAIAALRRQASHEDTSAVWNNLGVAHIANGNRQGALSAFKYALTKKTQESASDAFLALRNIIAMLVDNKNYEEAIDLAKAGLKGDVDRIVHKNKRLSEIYTFMLFSLRKTNQNAVAIKIAERLLYEDGAVLELKIWVVSHLLAQYANVSDFADKALSLARTYKPQLDSLKDINEPLMATLVNNLTFAFAENNQLDEANSLLPYLSNYIHKDAYPTATLGLLNLRKGHIERATKLYEEAIRLAFKSDDKKRIRQKLNLELGLYFLPTDTLRAQRLLKKAEGEREGDNELRLKANAALSLLRPVSDRFQQ